jgi:hypothetical protein
MGEEGTMPATAVELSVLVICVGTEPVVDRVGGGRPARGTETRAPMTPSAVGSGELLSDKAGTV